MVELTINGQPHRLEVDPEMPLLWVLREELALTGTKFGCGIGACGACTVHVDGTPARSCLVSVGAVAGRAITTIEGLAADGPHPLQQAWIARNVPQCGYCQSGQIMTAAALLAGNPSPSDAEIDQAMAGNLCRCGSYQRIREAIRLAAESLRPGEAVPAGQETAP
jgi:isoquinoline 1-oxidoreductase alpha subunit